MAVKRKVKNCVQFKRYPDIGNLALLHAAYKTQEFKPHFHEGHVLGVIECGQLGFDYRGERLTASAGEINLADPGEVHNGFCVSESGWQYRMFYLEQGQLEKISDEIADRKIGRMPFFKKGVIKDKVFAQKILDLHRDFEDPEISLLEKESRFHSMMIDFVLRHCPQKPAPHPLGAEKKAVKLVKNYIDNHYSTRISLNDLSKEANISRYYLLRVFAKETGLTPHEYLNMTRASQAKIKLDQGLSIVSAACDSGFYDQSHLNRIFKRIYGITPGMYKG